MSFENDLIDIVSDNNVVMNIPSIQNILIKFGYTPQHDKFTKDIYGKRFKFKISIFVRSISLETTDKYSGVSNSCNTMYYDYLSKDDFLDKIFGIYKSIYEIDEPPLKLNTNISTQNTDPEWNNPELFT